MSAGFGSNSDQEEILKCVLQIIFSESSAQAKHSFGNGTKQNYWAKGTGFGTGSTASSWNIEKAMSDKIKEEEELVIIFQVSF